MALFPTVAVALLSFLAASASAQNCPVQSICFAMDRSGSMRGFYDREQAFVVSVARSIGARSPAGTSYSAWGFAGSAFSISPRTTNLNGAFVPAINAPVSPAGATNMYRGLNSCFTALGGAAGFGGSGNRVIVLVTDGQDTGTPRAITRAPAIKAAGVSIVTVGIGNVDQGYLRRIATMDELFVPTSINDLTSNAQRVANTACKAPMMSPRPKVMPKPIMPPPPTSYSSCQAAYASCGFRFIGKPTVPTVALGPPDRVFTNRIMSRKSGEIVGILNTNKIIPQFIRRDGAAFNITRFAKPHFRPTHFKPFMIRRFMPQLNMTAFYSGIGHQKFHGSQWTVAKGRCVRVYFTHYQVLNSGRRPWVIDNKVVGKKANKCVVFLTRS